MKALLVVDIQNDFLPGGALAVEGGNEIIPIVNDVLQKPFDLIVGCKDWHPPDHCSFSIWPVHCVRDTPGAEFSPYLASSKIQKIFLKGTEKKIDAYGAFYDNNHLRSTGLDDYLKARKVTDLYIIGLTTEYCVKYTTLDALKLGYNTFVIKDGCRPVNLNPTDEAEAYKEMEQAGAHIITSIECTF